MSDYIARKSEQIVDRYIKHGIGDPKKVVDLVQDELYDIRNEKDKLRLLTAVLEANDEEYSKHLEVCTNLKSCSTNQDHEQVAYYLGQELADLGINMDEDAFTKEEKAASNATLDTILMELKDIKDGQQIMYDDLIREVEELKKWYILGKKNWKALYAGKVAEMVASGVVAEATAKPLLGFIKEIPKLIG